MYESGNVNKDQSNEIKNDLNENEEIKSESNYSDNDDIFERADYNITKRPESARLKFPLRESLMGGAYNNK